MTRSVLLLLTALFLPFSGASAGPLVLKTVSQEANTLKFAPGKPDAPGFSIEVIRELSRVDPDLTITGTDTYFSTRRIELALQANEIDVFFGLIKTPDRMWAMDFVESSLFYTQYGQLAVKADDPVQVRTLTDVRALGRDGVIGVPQGSAFVNFLRIQGGLSVDDGAVSVVATLEKLLRGRIRFVYFGGAVLAGYIRDGGLNGKIQILPPRFNTERVYVVTSKALAPDRRKRLEADLSLLENSRVLDRLRAKYQVD